MKTSVSPRERAELLADGILRDFHHAIRRVVNLYGNGDEAMAVIDQEAIAAVDSAGLTISKAADMGFIDTQYNGERRDLIKLLGCNHWAGVIPAIARRETLPEIRVGDYLKLPVKVPETDGNGLEFEALDIDEAEAVVIEVVDGKVIFQFDDIILHNAMNESNTNKGGFPESDLGKYLNGIFSQSVFGNLADMLTPNRDGLKITLPTLFEVFGDRDDKSMNWSDNPYQFDYFKKRKNRIKTFGNDTNWWWLATPYAGGSTTFCAVGSLGLSSYSGASSAAGGVAPAICIS